MFEDSFFKQRKVIIDKALLYGFTEIKTKLQYQTTIHDEQFRLQVDILSSGEVCTKVIEIDTGEEYVLYKVANGAGTFSGEIRQAVSDILTEISLECFEADVFKSKQAQLLIEYIRNKYADELEFLWPKFSNNAVWRRKDNQKWYAAVLFVSRQKLGLPSDEMVEIIDLRLQPELLTSLIDNESYFPGWHMNKKHWYTIILDGTVAIEEIYQRIDESYDLAFK